MKIPPSPERVAPAASAVRTEHDRSFLIFAGVVLMAMAIGFKSELLGEGQVWALALGLIVVAAPALLGYLRGTEEFPRIEHYIPVALGAITLAGLAGGHDTAGHPLVPELWKYGLITAAFGPPSLSSSDVNVRPASGLVPKINRKNGKTSVATSIDRISSAEPRNLPMTISHS